MKRINDDDKDEYELMLEERLVNSASTSYYTIQYCHGLELALFLYRLYKHHLQNGEYADGTS